LLISLLVIAAGAQESLATRPDGKPSAFRLQMVDPAIRKAIQDTLAEEPAKPPQHNGPALSAEPYRNFARKMDEAEVPSCWRPDAMKHQLPRIGPIALGGLLALPFWGAAILRGKCNK
jgi:hypothetical protein